MELSFVELGAHALNRGMRSKAQAPGLKWIQHNNRRKNDNWEGEGLSRPRAEFEVRKARRDLGSSEAK
jgi:hypothetical protein